MQLFLGVDGGQSGTAALVADESGEILGKGSGGPCNHVSREEGKEKLIRVIRQCVGEALIQAGLPQDSVFASACFGMSGGPDDKAEILAGAVASKHWKVIDDAQIALTGALGGNAGIVVIGGTGSIALGRDAEGHMARAGGWGYLFGDEGGAFDIVKQALRAALRAEEGWGETTLLCPLFLQKTGCKDVNGVMHAFYSPDWPRARVAALAGAVDACAQAGDEISMQVMGRAGKDLADFAQTIRARLWGELGRPNCSYVGGVFASGILLREFRSVLAASNCVVTAPQFGPAMGALIEAFRAAGQRKIPDKLLSSEFRYE